MDNIIKQFEKLVIAAAEHFTTDFHMGCSDGAIVVVRITTERE